MPLVRLLVEKGEAGERLLSLNWLFGLLVAVERRQVPKKPAHANQTKMTVSAAGKTTQIESETTISVFKFLFQCNSLKSLKFLIHSVQGKPYNSQS